MPKKSRITISMTPTFQIVHYISSGQKNSKQCMYLCNSWLTINPSWRRALRELWDFKNLSKPEIIAQNLRVNWMKSVPSSSWRALLSLFRIRGALVDPRPWRLQGESDIFVWNGNPQGGSQATFCLLREWRLNMRSFYSTHPPRETIGRETVWGVVWGDIRVVHLLHHLSNEQGIIEYSSWSPLEEKKKNCSRSTSSCASTWTWRSRRRTKRTSPQPRKSDK